MKLFTNTDRDPILQNNINLHADDTLFVTMHFEVSHKCIITTEMIDEAKKQMEALFCNIFGSGIGEQSIEIADLYSSYLLKDISRLERKIAKLEIKSSILRLLGFRRG